jgi:hypothetical protein
MTMLLQEVSNIPQARLSAEERFAKTVGVRRSQSLEALRLVHQHPSMPLPTIVDEKEPTLLNPWKVNTVVD